MAKKRRTAEKTPLAPVDPVEVYISLNEYIRRRYPTISVSDMDAIVALFIMDCDEIGKKLAPELVTEDLKDTVSTFLEDKGTANNSLYRILTYVDLFFAGIEKAKQGPKEDE